MRRKLLLFLWIFEVSFALDSALQANPFDPRFRINVDELCSDGDLYLSVPLMRLRLDDDVTLLIRAEHVLQSSDYNYVRSTIALRPLSTSLAPCDLDAVMWRKPNGEDLVMHKANADDSHVTPKLSTLSHETMDALADLPYTIYSSGNTTAWVGNASAWGFVASEHFQFYYENGALLWFVLPSGKKIIVHSEGSRICEFRTTNGPLLTIQQISDNKRMIVTKEQRMAHSRIKMNGI